MRHPPRHNQTPIAQFPLNLLPRDQRATPEVVGGGFEDVEGDFDFLAVEPDAVFFEQLLLDVGLAVEGVGGCQQAADLAEAVGFEAVAVDSGQVPDAAVVDELVGGDVDGFGAVVFGVDEADALALLDGAFELVEQLGAGFDVFVLRALYAQRGVASAFAQFLHQLGVKARVQAFQAGGVGEVFEFAQGLRPGLVRVKLVAVRRFFQRQDVADARQVALQSPDADAEFIGQRGQVQDCALVQACQHVAQSMRQTVVVRRLRAGVSSLAPLFLHVSRLPQVGLDSREVCRRCNGGLCGCDRASFTPK